MSHEYLCLTSICIVTNHRKLQKVHAISCAGALLIREEYPAKKNGMPLIDPAKVPLVGINGRYVTWIGHASLLFQHNGVSVLTDPCYRTARRLSVSVTQNV